MKLKFHTEKGTNCSPCPLKEDCDELQKYTICELANIPDGEIIVKVTEEN